PRRWPTAVPRPATWRPSTPRAPGTCLPAACTTWPPAVPSRPYRPNTSPPGAHTGPARRTARPTTPEATSRATTTSTAANPAESRNRTERPRAGGGTPPPAPRCGTAPPPSHRAGRGRRSGRGAGPPPGGIAGSIAPRRRQVAVLGLEQAVVHAPPGVQLVVGARLHDAAVVQDQDAVRAADGGQAVGHHEGGPALEQPPQRLLDQQFRL